jgi:hypothetical protein
MRSGVLSDLAIKSAYPEYQPLNIGLSQAVESVVFDKHELVGVRLPKNYKPKSVPRFPINDLNNFSTLSSAPNKSKQVYTSIQSYRKKLGSSNVDTEMRQSMRPRITAANEPVAYMSNNFEMKMRGGVVDKIKSNAVSQADIYANAKKVPHDKIIEANKSIRTEGAKMASVERRINMENLDNFNLATETAHERIARGYTDYLTNEFNKTSGGEIYYNYLTTRDYHARRNPDRHHEGYKSKNMTLSYNVDLRTKEDMTGRDPDEYGEPDKNITNTQLENLKNKLEGDKSQVRNPPYATSVEDLPEPDTAIYADEVYSSAYIKDGDKTKKLPFKVSKKEKSMKQEDVDKMEAQMIDDPNEPQLPMSAASRNDPKKIPNNLADFIRQKEETKMKDPAYQEETDKYLINRSKLTQQKRIDEIELTPKDYKEKYGFTKEQKRREIEREKEHTNKTPSESSNLGMQLREKRFGVAELYREYSGTKLHSAQLAKQNNSGQYIQERDRVYDERQEYDAMYDEAFGTNPIH